MAKKSLYTHARFYYMNAYRERMKTIRSDWTTGMSPFPFTFTYLVRCC